MARMNITQVRKGDVVRFASYALRVEAEPARKGSAVVLRGRTSVDGCPLVTRNFNSSLDVEVSRQSA